MDTLEPIHKVVHYKGETYITCEEVVTFLLHYLSGDLAHEKQHDFERHLGICPSCVSYLKTYKLAVELAKATARDEKPADLGEELVRAILAARAQA